MKKFLRFFSAFFFFAVCSISAQSVKNGIFSLDSFSRNIKNPNSGNSVELDTLWKVQNGDNANWALPAFNDSLWPQGSTWEIYPDSKSGRFSDITWFRLRLYVAPALRMKPLALSMRNWGACEIFVDGKNMGGFGVVSKDSANEKRFSPNSIPLGIVFNDADTHLIALRYSNHGPVIPGTKFKTGFQMQVAEEESALAQMEGSIRGFNMFIGFLSGLFFTLGFIHFLLWMYYRARISNLYYSIFSLCLATLFFTIILITNSHDPQLAQKFDTLYATLWTLVPMVLLLLLYSLFYERYPLICKIFVGLYAIVLVTTFFNWGWGRYFYWCLLFASSIELLRIVVWAIVKKKPGGWTVAWGILGFLLLFIGLFFFVIVFLDGFDKVDWTSASGILISILYIVGVLCIPISMSVYLARQFAQTNKSLTKKLIEVNELSEKSIEQEKEKQKILETQKEKLEQQVKERTAEITEQAHLLQEKNKDITDSINYAQKIQEAILPAKEIKYKLFPEAFVLFQPRDIVSGDFYWFTEVKGTPSSSGDFGGRRKDEKHTNDPDVNIPLSTFRIIAAADCTGHGVPGAFMSMIGNAFLNEIVNQKKITKPSEILNLLREHVIHALKQTGAEGENKDGMDIALCCFDEKNETLQFAGANNPLWLIRNGKCIEYVATKQPIGYQAGDKIPFSNHEIKLEKGDACYMFTDGFADQFGGPKGKKFKYKQLQEILISIQDKKMSEQEIILQKVFNEWKGKLEQIDDVLLIGVKVV